MTPKEHLIVYVDDELGSRVVFEQTFGNKYRLRVCSSGLEALEILQAEVVSVLITDQRMPGMSGQELLEKCKELYPDTVRVVITAYSDLDPILSAVNEGLVARYIVKPWDRAELDALLEWALDAFEMGKQSSVMQLRLMQTERLVTLGSIAAQVLHDLKNPLNNIDLNTDRLRELSASSAALAAYAADPHSPLSPVERKRVAELAAELPDIVRDLKMSVAMLGDLTAGFGQSLKTDPATTAIDPMPVIQHAISVCRGEILRARGRVIYDGPPTLPKVQFGHTELAQVLINLIANGAHAIGERRERGGRVVVRAEPQPGAVQFTITDDGVGMTPEVLQRVGTAFFSTRAEGTGLGVAQCKRLIARQGGELSIESKPGRGTVVQFSLRRA
jgi:signal transduction histidine kinase